MTLALEITGFLEVNNQEMKQNILAGIQHFSFFIPNKVHNVRKAFFKHTRKCNEKETLFFRNQHWNETHKE